MNLIKRLFKKKIKEKDLDKLVLALGKSKEFVDSLYYQRQPDYCVWDTYGKLDVQKRKKEFLLI